METSSENSTLSKPRRRWLRFSLRAILVVVTVVCVGLAITARHYRQRRAAIRAIDELGGSYGVQLLGPEWLRKLVDDDKYFYNAVRITLGRSSAYSTNAPPFGDKELAQIIDQINLFTGPRILDLQDSAITDEGLRELVRVRDLEMLGLQNTVITDAGLVHLESLSTLKELELEGNQVTPEGVAKLRTRLPNCKIQYRPPKIN